MFLGFQVSKGFRLLRTFQIEWEIVHQSVSVVTNSLVIHSFSQSVSQLAFSSIYSQHNKSQTVINRELKFLKNVYPTPCVTYHVSCVTSQKKFTIFFMKRNYNPTKKIDNVVKLVGRGSVIVGAYPVQFLDLAAPFC